MDGDAIASITADPVHAADGQDPVLARRLDVVTRLLERGMPVRVLEALLPEWDAAIDAAVRTEPPAA